MKNKKTKAVLFIALAAFALPASPAAAAAERPNILFIAIDDMNDWTGFLGGHPQAKTPNMDRLADRGVNFRNAHCPAPGCSPSRNALLFGVQPFNSGLYPFYQTEQIDPEVLAQYTTLPQLFKESGYHTYASGKIHHGVAWTYELDDGAREWTEHNHKRAIPRLVHDTDAGYVQRNGENQSRKMAFCPTASPLEDHPDYITAQYGLDVLGRAHDRPFFLALGFKKPHLPFVAPKPYFDLHAGPIQAPPVKAGDLADISWPGRGNARLNDDLRYRNEDAWEQVRRAYLACISWTDANVGRVLDALEAGPYRDNTIVVLWSDHGYHLGEKRSFRKFSLWEEATRVPFIIWDARQPDKHGRVCDAPASLIDIYPTLVKMAGLKKPAYVDGIDLAPWLENPGRPREAPAITTWGRGNYTLRTRAWRYTRYFDGSEELYRHDIDRQEWTNLAQSPEYILEKRALQKWLPKNEAPLIKKGISLHGVIDADKPSLESVKNTWKRINAVIQPPLE